MYTLKMSGLLWACTWVHLVMGKAVVWTGDCLSIGDMFAPLCHSSDRHFGMNMLLLLPLVPYAEGKIVLSAYCCGALIQVAWWHCFFKHTAFGVFGVLGLSTVIYVLYGYYYFSWLIVSQLLLSLMLEITVNDVGVSVYHISGYISGILMTYLI